MPGSVRDGFGTVLLLARACVELTQSDRVHNAGSEEGRPAPGELQFAPLTLELEKEKGTSLGTAASC